MPAAKPTKIDSRRNAGMSQGSLLTSRLIVRLVKELMAGRTECTSTTAKRRETKLKNSDSEKN